MNEKNLPPEPDLWGPGMQPTTFDGIATIVLIIVLYIILGYGLWENWETNKKSD